MSPSPAPKRSLRATIALIVSLLVLPQAVAAVKAPAPAKSAVDAAVTQGCIDFDRKPRSTTAPDQLGDFRSTAGYNAGATVVLAVATRAADAVGDTSPDAQAAKTALVKQIQQTEKPDWSTTPHCTTFSNTSVDPTQDRQEASEPTAAGGLSAIDEIWVTSMLTVARYTPSIWDHLAGWEKFRLDLIMRGELISNAFVMSDSNPYVGTTPPGPQRQIDGNTNINRDWNPAYYRSSGIGNVLLAAAYFNEPDQPEPDRPEVRNAVDELNAWATSPETARAQFLRYVTRRKMDNLKETFGGGTLRDQLPWWDGVSTTTPNPSPVPNTPGAPTDAEIGQALTDWKYKDIPITKPMELYAKIANYTYDKPVACGIGAGGAGITATQVGTTPIPTGKAGRLDDPADCSKLAFPVGTPGMIHDFDSADGSQQRSSATSAYADFKTDMAITTGLKAAGVWNDGPIGTTPQTGADLAALQTVGASDLFRKLELGYVSVQSGKAVLSPGAPSGGYTQRLSEPGSYGNGYTYTRSLWRDVVNEIPLPDDALVQRAIDSINGPGCMDFSRQGISSTTPPTTSTGPKPVTQNDQNKGAIGLVALAARDGWKTAVDAELKQIRYTIRPADDVTQATTPRCGPGATSPGVGRSWMSNEPTAVGGQYAQQDIWVALMFLAAKRTPAVWNALSTDDKERIDLIMQGILVSNAYVTSDNNFEVRFDSTNPTTADSSDHTIDGDPNVKRFWNANYPQAMFGNILIAAAYFGADTQSKLTGFSRSSYLAAVTSKKLYNLAWTFTDRPPTTPTETQIHDAIDDWHVTPDVTTPPTTATSASMTMSDPMKIYRWLTTDMFGKRINCGLAGGVGKLANTPQTTTALPSQLAGMVAFAAIGTTPTVDHCKALLTYTTPTGPTDDYGKVGMIEEFDSGDKKDPSLAANTSVPTTGQQRSSLRYAYMAYKGNLATQLGLLISGDWQPGNIPAVGTTPTSTTGDIVALKQIGIRDMFRKFDLGYTGRGRALADAWPQSGASLTNPSPEQFIISRSIATQTGYEDSIDYTEALWYRTLMSSPLTNR